MTVEEKSGVNCQMSDPNEEQVTSIAKAILETDENVPIQSARASYMERKTCS